MNRAASIFEEAISKIEDLTSLRFELATILDLLTKTQRTSCWTLALRCHSFRAR